METFTIREAAGRCNMSYQALRRRVDRGSLQVLTKDGARRIPRAELERAGLWPGAQSGAPEEIQRLQDELERLQGELRELRPLPQKVDAERAAREEIEQAFHRERSERQAAEQQLLGTQEAREWRERLATAGWRERRRLLRELRAQRAA